MITPYEIEANKKQILLSFLSILTILTSIILLYNEQLKNNHNKPILNSKQEQNISIINRTIILIILFSFLIINYNLYNISKEKGENLKPSILQLVASSLIVIAAMIVLYIVATSANNEIDIENPTI